MKTIIAAVTLSLLLMLSACSREPVTMKERYPGGWRTDFHVGISRALAQNKIRDCGEFKYKPSANTPSGNIGEYLVRCTRNGTTWQSYLVWAGIDNVMGPYPTNPTMN